MRILIADDSVFMRSAIGRAFAMQDDFEIVGKARNGLEAVSLAKELRPDVVTMDIEMPQMDGITALRKIMREAPTQVLMCSTLTTEGSMRSLQALRLGAADVLPKDSGGTVESKKVFLQGLVDRVRALGESKRHYGHESEPEVADHEAKRAAPLALRASDFDLLCIGSSTGGPPILETLLTKLPSDLKVPVVIAQHMPRVFTESMAARLNEICPLTVLHAEDRMLLAPGMVYVAPGGQHTSIHRNSIGKYRLKICDEPKEYLYMPSADVLFGTAAKAAGSRVLSIILTGIGDDGVRGAKLLHQEGAPILAQNQRSCVVYGMPRAVAEAGYATAVLSPDQIADALGRLTRRAAA